MAHDRDLFANFERMRREMEELFGDAFDRGLSPRRRTGFTPAVDVYYLTDPPRAVVKADLAGIDPDELDQGPFRRVVPLGAEVDADATRARYESGMLVVELPVVQREPAVRHVPIE